VPRHIHIIGARLVAVGMAALVSSVSTPAQDSPTLQQTYEWLVAQMPQLSVIAEPQRIHSPEMWWKNCDVQFFAYQVGSSRVTRDVFERARQTRGFGVVSFNFGDLNLASITKQGILVEVSTTGSKHISYVDRLEWVKTDGSVEPAMRNGQGVVTTVAFQTGDPKLQDRLVRAITNAIRLCGGTAAPELFGESAKPIPAPREQDVAAPESSEKKPSKPAPVKRPVSRPALSIRIAPSETGYVNVRKSADINSPIVGRLRPGERYVASSQTGDWFRIDAKGGWVNKRYIIVQ
jgi:hypothetical protein